MAARKQSDADVQEVMRVNPQEPTIREMTKDWSTADFDYGMSRLDVDTNIINRLAMRDLLRMIRSGREFAELQELAEAEEERRHGAVKARLDELKKPHWTVLPSFWLTLISAIAAVAAAIFGYLALK